MIETVLSQNKIPIRLTDERWSHITEEHCELAGMRLEILETITNPFRILEGGDEETGSPYKAVQVWEYCPVLLCKYLIFLYVLPKDMICNLLKLLTRTVL